MICGRRSWLLSSTSIAWPSPFAGPIQVARFRREPDRDFRNAVLVPCGVYHTDCVVLLWSLQWMIAPISVPRKRGWSTPWIVGSDGRMRRRRPGCWSAAPPPTVFGYGPAARDPAPSRIGAMVRELRCAVPFRSGSLPIARPIPIRPATPSSGLFRSALGSRSASGTSTVSAPLWACASSGPPPPKKSSHSAGPAHRLAEWGRQLALAGRRARNWPACHVDRSAPPPIRHCTSPPGPHAPGDHPGVAADVAIPHGGRITAHLGSAQLYRHRLGPPDGAPVGLRLSACRAVLGRPCTLWRGHAVDRRPRPMDDPAVVSACPSSGCGADHRGSRGDGGRLPGGPGRRWARSHYLAAIRPIYRARLVYRGRGLCTPHLRSGWHAGA